MMMLFIVAYAIAGTQIFGQQLREYKNEPEAFKTLFLILLGEFDFARMERVDPTAAIIFFYSYVGWVFFVMLNIFLAILNDSYTAIVEQFDDEPEETSEWLSIAQRYHLLQSWWRQRGMDKRIELLRKERRGVELAERREHQKKLTTQRKQQMQLDMLQAQKQEKKSLALFLIWPTSGTLTVYLYGATTPPGSPPPPPPPPTPPLPLPKPRPTHHGKSARVRCKAAAVEMAASGALLEGGGEQCGERNVSNEEAVPQELLEV